MKKITLTLLAVLGLNAAVSAQGNDTITSKKEGKTHLYVGLGAAVNDGFKINDRLKAAGMPEIGGAAFESTIGFNVMFDKFTFDLEWVANYMDDKNNESRIKTINTGIKFRPHYVISKSKKFFVTAGADVSYMFNSFSLYNRGSRIDLNDLDPATNPGILNLNNQQLFAGPSVSVGLLQNTEWALKFNTGYEWALISGKWKSEFAEVDNSLKENGQGRFYAKLSFIIN